MTFLQGLALVALVVLPDRLARARGTSCPNVADAPRCPHCRGVLLAPQGRDRCPHCGRLRLVVAS